MLDVPTRTLPQVVSLPVDEIEPNPFQPRRVFDKAQLEELAASIREYGVIQPVSVRRLEYEDSDRFCYELVAGERRLKASKLAGMSYIPAIITNMNDRDSAMIALIENIQRQDLNFMEEAEGLRLLIDEFGFTQERLAVKVGKNQSTVANKLRLLKLPETVQTRLVESGLTERHARAMLKVRDEEQMHSILDKVIRGKLNVSMTEQLIERANLETAKNKGFSPLRLKMMIKDLRIFTNTIQGAVDMMNKSGLATVYELEEKPEGCYIKIAVNY